MTRNNMNNPYVGPRTFSKIEADRFFGREVEARQLFSRIISERLVLFYAQSGAGKSSLINTRIIPRLQDEKYAILPVGRISGQLPQGIDHVDNVYVFNLMLSLDQGNRSPERLVNINLSKFLAQLTIDSDGHWFYDENISSTKKAEGYEEVPYVLIIDQFEEIITTLVEYWPQRDDFFQQINEALINDPLMGVVLVLREDYVAALEPYSRFVDDKMRARFYMQRLTYEAALEAVAKPAKLGERPFAPGVAEELVNNLRQIRVHGKIAPQEGQFIEPVHLQVVCYQLWENLSKQQNAGSQITSEDLQTLGDVDHALADYYIQTIKNAMKVVRTEKTIKQKVYEFLQGKSLEADLRKWVNEKLITEAETRGTVYRGEHHTAGMSNLAVDSLADQYLLRSEIRAGGIWYELTHDRFIQPILKENRRWLSVYISGIKPISVIIPALFFAFVIVLLIAITDTSPFSLLSLAWQFASAFIILLIIGILIATVIQGVREVITIGRLTFAGRLEEAGSRTYKNIRIIAILIVGFALLILCTGICSLVAAIGAYMVS